MALRRALLVLSEAVGSDPLRPQEVSRQLGLNKNLTWKIARVLGSRDCFEAVAMLPGVEGVEIYLRAFESAGAAAALIQSAREAFGAIDRVVRHHFGDRSQLDLVLDGVRADANLEQSRRLAFRGMSGVFGVQAKVRLTTHLVVPSAEDGLADIALIVGLVGLQRLRPRGKLPVFRWSAPTPDDRVRSRPLFGGEHETDFLLREFSSFPNATVLSSAKGGTFVTELSEGPLGRIGESELFFGTRSDGIMRPRRSEADSECELVTIVSIPAEGLVSDLFIHKSFGGLETLEASLHSTLARPLSGDRAERESARLPIDVSPMLIEDLEEGFGLPEAPRYEEMVRRSFEQLGHDLRDHRLVRVALPFPPAPSALLVRWDLPE